MAASIEERQETTNAPTQFNLINTLTTVAGLAGIFYAVGLVVFILQLLVTFELDFATALHAASLVSQIVILGQGLRVLVIPTFLFTAVLLPAFLFYASPKRVRKMFEEAEQKDGTNKKVPKSRFFTFATKILFPISFIVFVLFPIGIALFQGNWRQLISLIIYLIVGVVIGLVLLFTAEQGHSLRRRSFVSFSILLVGSFIAAFVSGQLAQPPLPPVQIQSQGQQIQGTLLVHTDGYWYVFTNPSKALQVIPDGIAENIILSP